MDKKANIYLLGIKKFMMVFLACLITLTTLALCGAFPTIYAQVEGGSDFKDIQGCFYSLTPSTYGSLTNNSSGQQKYCYTLADEGSNSSNYKYLSDTNGDVYAFEYYTYLENNALPTEKIAVYSKLDTLQAKTLSDGTIVYQDTTNDGKLYKTVSDYLFYYLRKFTPSWQDTNTYVYSGDTLVSKADGASSYFAYEPTSSDYWNEYQNIDVYTRYKFDLTGNDNNVIYYEGVTYDPETDTVIPTGTCSNGQTDGSVYQIITREDTNAVTYVLKQQGDAYVTTDINGHKPGEDGFSRNTYYQGNQVYVYDNAIKTSDTTGSFTVEGFRIYTLTGETKTFDQLKDYTSSEGYSLITLDRNNSPLMEAIRYYNLYEITYELKDTESSLETVKDTYQDDINNRLSKNVNQVFNYDKNGNPTSFDVTYTYTFEYYQGSTYTVTYKIRQAQLPYKVYNQLNTTTWTISKMGSTSTNNPSSISNSYTALMDGNSVVDISKYDSNTLFYVERGSKVEDKRTGEHTYSWSNANLTFGDYTTNDLSNANEDINKNGVTTESDSIESWDNVDWSVIETRPLYTNVKKPSSNISISGYNVNGTWYKNKSEKNAIYDYSYTQEYNNVTVTEGNKAYVWGDYDGNDSSVRPSNSYSSVPTVYNKDNRLLDASKSKFLYWGIKYTDTEVYSKKVTLYTIKFEEIKYHALYNSRGDYNSELGWASEWGMPSKCQDYRNKVLTSDGDNPSSDTIKNKVRTACQSNDGWSNDTKSLHYNKDFRFEGDTWRKNNWDSSQIKCTTTCAHSGETHQGDYRSNHDMYALKFTEVKVTITRKTEQVIYYQGLGEVGMYLNYNQTNNSCSNKTRTLNFLSDDVGEKTYYSSTDNHWYERAYLKTNYNYQFSFGTMNCSSSNNFKTATAKDSKVPDALDAGNYTYYFEGQTTANYRTQYTYSNPQSWTQTTVNINLPTKPTIKISEGSCVLTPTYTNGYYEISVTDLSNYVLNHNLITIENLPSDSDSTQGLYYGTTRITNLANLNRTFRFTQTITGTDKGKITLRSMVNRNAFIYNYTLDDGTVLSYKALVKNLSFDVSDTTVKETYYYFDLYKFTTHNSSTGYNNTNSPNTQYTYIGLKEDGTLASRPTDYPSNNATSWMKDNFVAGKVSYTIKQNDTRNYTVYDYNNLSYVYTNDKKTNDAQQTAGQELNSTKYVLESSSENKHYANKQITFTLSKYNRGDGSIADSDFNAKIQEAGYNLSLIRNGTLKQSSYSVVNRYSGTYYGHTFTLVETGNWIPNGNVSKTFGTNNTTVRNYYTGSANTTYDNFIANMTWQGTVSAPNSYNRFNSDTYFENYGKTNYLRTSINNEITTYTTQKAISLNLSNVMNERSQGSTLYWSYYLNGTKKSGSFTKGSFAQSYTVSIPAGNISKIMVSWENKDYSPYGNVTVNTDSASKSAYGYREEYIGNKLELSYEYYDTPYTFQARITNLSDLINEDGTWNSNKNVYYEISYNGVDRDGKLTQQAKKFTYVGKNYQTTLELGNGLALQLDPSKTQALRYVLTREIVKVTESYNGNFYNISEGQRNNNQDSKYFASNKFAYTVPNGTNNNKNTVKDTEGNIIKIDSLPGKLALLQILGNGNFTGFVYVRNNKLIQVNGQNVYQYYKYYDDNKLLSSDGKSFEYLDKGYEIASTDNYVFDLIDLIQNENLRPENAKKNTGLQAKNVFTDISSQRGLISFNDNKNKVDGLTSYNNLSDYNNYVVNSGSSYSQEYTAINNTALPFLLLATKSLDLTNRVIYVDNNNNHYKLFDGSSMIANNLGYDKNEIGYTVYDEFKASGAWQRIDDLDRFVNSSDTVVDKKPVLASYTDMATGKVYFTVYVDDYGQYQLYTRADGANDAGIFYKDGKIANLMTYPYIEKVYLLDNLLIYKIKSTADIPEQYRGKYFTEKPGAYIKQTVEEVRDDNDNIIQESEYEVFFDSTDNVNNSIDIPYVSATNYINDLKSPFEYSTSMLNAFGNPAKATVYLSFTQKVPMYYFLKSENYILDYYSNSSNADDYAQLDMRYQFSTLDSEIGKFIKEGNTPVMLYGDDLSQDSLTTYVYYLASKEGEEITKNSIQSAIYNGVMTDNKLKGGLKAGYVYSLDSKGDPQKVAEKLYYGGSVYYLGNFVDGTGNSAAGNNSFYIELREYIQMYYEYAMSKTDTTNSLFSYYDKENKKFTGFLSAVPVTYDEFTDYMIKKTISFYVDGKLITKSFDKSSAIEIMRKYFGYSGEREDLNHQDLKLQVPMLDMTSNFYNVSINLLDKSINVTYKSSLLNSRSKSQHYIQLGDYIYYRQEDSNHNAITLDKITSYLGVDLAVDAGQGTSAGDNSTEQKNEAIANGVLAGIGLVLCLIPGTQGIGVPMLAYNAFNAVSIGVLKLNQRYASNLISSSLATVAYSPLIYGGRNVNKTSPYVTLQDILNSTNENRYFVEVIAGSGEGTWVKNSNSLPTVNVELKRASDASTVNTTKGFKTFSFSGEDSMSRFILSDSPRNLVITQCNNFGDWVTGGAGQMSIPSKVKMYVSNKRNRDTLWDEENEDTNVYYYTRNADGSNNAINLNDATVHNTLDLGADGQSIIVSGKATETFNGKNGTTFEKTLKREVIGDSLGGKFVVTGGLTSGDLEASGSFFEDFASYATNGITHVGEWVSNTFTTIGSNIMAWFRGEETKEMPSIFCYNYRIITFYNFKFSNTLPYADSFEVTFNTLDTDYTSSTNYQITITDTSGLDKPSAYAYELYYPYDATTEKEVASGYVYNKEDGNCYYNDKSATSHVNNTGSIKNVIQESKVGESYIITGLAPKKNMVLKLYNVKTSNYTTIATNYSIGANSSTDSKGVKTAVINSPEGKDHYFSFYTGANMVYNPYGTDKGQRSKIFTEVRNNGDSYLLDNAVIDYDVSKFIFGATTVNHPTSNFTNSPSVSYNFTYSEMQKKSTGKGDIYYYAPVNKELLFSGRYLAQKYLETDNVSKIVFGLRIKETVKNNKNFNDLLYGYNNSDAEVVIYSHKQNKYILGSVDKGIKLVNFVANSTKIDSNNPYNGMFEYVLTDEDKRILKGNTYKKNVEAFVSDYLLNDNFEFRFKGLFNSKDTDNIFNLVWQPYYENTMTYLNLNQSFEKNSNNSFDFDKPTYDAGTKLSGEYYDINGNMITSEAGTYMKGNYSHVEVGNSGLSETETNLKGWKVAGISLTDTKGQYFKNIKELGIVYANNYRTEWIALCIITDGESHIYS